MGGTAGSPNLIRSCSGVMSGQSFGYFSCSAPAWCSHSWAEPAPCRTLLRVSFTRPRDGVCFGYVVPWYRGTGPSGWGLLRMTGEDLSFACREPVLEAAAQTQLADPLSMTVALSAMNCQS